MAANTTPVFPGALKTPAPITFVNADGTAYKTVATGNAAGSLLEKVSVTSDDTSPVTLKVALQVSGTDYPIGEVTVAAGSGTNGTAKSVNLLGALSSGVDLVNVVRPDGSLCLPPNVSLRVGPKAAVTAAKVVTVVPHGWDF